MTIELNRRRTEGFTLIELSIVLVVSAVLMVMIMDAFLHKIHEDKRSQTVLALANTQAALTEYVGTYVRYPCPADPTLSPSDARYGYEQVDGAGKCTFNDVRYTPVPGKRGNDLDASGQPKPDTVYFGAVPFKTINAPPGLTYTRFTAADTIDGFGDKLGYAVTGSMTSASTYDDKHGAIDVIDENKISLMQPPSTAQVVVFSFGDNGRGARTRDGAEVLTCDTNTLPLAQQPTASSPESDWENCTNKDNVFLSGLRSVASPSSYNDDIVKFLSTRNGNFWTITGCVNNDCTNSPIIYKVQNTNVGNVGIGIENPSTKLDMMGGLQVQSGNIQTANFCNQTGKSDTKANMTNDLISSYCFPPDLLGGNDANMDCAKQGTGLVMTGISQNKAVCAPVTFPKKAYVCPAGQFLTGISNLGNVQCQ